MSFTPQILLLAILLIWVGALTFFFIRFQLFYLRVSRGSKKDSLLTLIEEVMGRQDKIFKQLSENSTEIKELAEKNAVNIQKVGVYRFNPFKDTGGDQSFIITFLDAHDSGVLISGLHTRSGTRWYAKTVEHGKGKGYELSADEEKALQSAHVLH
jgi:hypothetical protein